jgi:hypothetical protein
VVHDHGSRHCARPRRRRNQTGPPVDRSTTLSAGRGRQEVWAPPVRPCAAGGRMRQGGSGEHLNR